MAQVGLENVSKVFPDGTRAVDAVSLEVADGEMVVLVGPSGCGKSTALRMVAGLEQATEGVIRIAGKAMDGVVPKLRDVAMVFQNYALYPHMTVRENLAFALRLRKTPKAERTNRVTDTASMLGIEALLDRKPAALSGGQQQRVALGRAIVREPACFLFDEPLSNLDAKLRVEMRAEIKRLHQRLSATSIYVTHDQEEAMTLADRLVVMRRGRVQQIGRPLDIYDNPANRFVASFVGVPSMNFLDGSVAMRDGKRFFQSGQVCIPVQHDASLKSTESIMLGVRPGAISISDAPTNALAFRAHVEVVELLGDRKDVRLATDDGQKITARVDGSTPVTVGQQMHVTFDSEQMYFFETTGEQRNLRRQQQSVTTLC